MKAVQARRPRKHDQSGRGAQPVQCRNSDERPSPSKIAALRGRFQVAPQPWMMSGRGKTVQRSHRSQSGDVLSLSIMLQSLKCLRCLDAKTPALKVLRAADITLRLRQLNLRRSGVIQPCDRHELCPIAPLVKADDPVNVSPHVARGMV